MYTVHRNTAEPESNMARKGREAGFPFSIIRPLSPDLTPPSTSRPRLYSVRLATLSLVQVGRRGVTSACRPRLLFAGFAARLLSSASRSHLLTTGHPMRRVWRDPVLRNLSPCPARTCQYPCRMHPQGALAAPFIRARRRPHPPLRRQVCSPARRLSPPATVCHGRNLLT